MNESITPDKGFVQKPLSVTINETRNELIKVIEESNLHASILEMIVKDLYLEVRNQANMITSREMATYNNSLKENSDDKGEN